MSSDLSLHTPTMIAILGMAAGVYLIRFAGLFLARRVTPSPAVEAFLGHLPGAMFTALIAPAILQGGILYIGAALATLAGQTPVYTRFSTGVQILFSYTKNDP